jgi:hypothetical protein
MKFLLNLIGGLGGQAYLYMALVFGGFSAGFYVEHLRFAEYKADVVAAGERQIAENKAKAKEQEIINDNVAKTYQDNISNIHTFYSRMLDTSSGAMSPNGTATITINGQTYNLLSVAEQCAQTTQQLESLQDWINQQVGLDAK